MSEPHSGVTSFVFLGAELSELTHILRSAFSHPWVASYQIGFGPPLIGASEGLRARLKYARSGMDKLRTYLEFCFYDDALRAKLASAQLRLLTRRHGPIEAEAVRRASAEVLDLSLRLHHPDRAPDAVREDMTACGVSPDNVPADGPPDAQAGRFWVHLADPRGERLLHADLVCQAVEDPASALALELQVPIAMRALVRHWCQALARDSGLLTIDLGAPTSVARVLRDGRRS